MRRTKTVCLLLSVLIPAAVGCQENAATPGGPCCELATISVCDCAAISWVTGAEEAIASDDPSTCQLMIDTILTQEGHPSVESLCEMSGWGCHQDSMQTCASGEAYAGACCTLAVLDTCECADLSWVTVAEEAIASGNQATCRAVYDAVVDDELQSSGYSSVDTLCEMRGNFGCWEDAKAACD